MLDNPSTESVRERAIALREMHTGPTMLVLPNAWDAASARAFAKAGFPAIATTSGGVAAALGFEDHQGAPASEMIAAAARITAAVNTPVTVDFEAGYDLSPEEVVRQLIDTGGAGFNFEDTDHAGGGLVDPERQAERIGMLRHATQAAGVPLVINARVDVFIQRRGTPEEQLQEGLRRATLYKQAGADCIYPIILADEAMIGEFVKAVGTININVRPGGPISLQKAASLGVRRVSYAVSIFRESLALIDRMASDIAAERSGIQAVVSQP